MFEARLNALVDVHRKIVIQAKHGRLDDDLSFTIWYEPALEPDKVDEEMPDDLQEVWRAHNDAPPPRSIIVSGERKELLTFFVYRKGAYIVSVDSQRRAVWARNTRAFHWDKDLLDMALCAMPSHPYWKKYGYGLPVEVNLSAE